MTGFRPTACCGRRRTEFSNGGNDAYRENPSRTVAERFALEATVSLPGVAPADASLDSYYSAVNLQRLRLKQNQQVPEWNGERYQ